MVIILDIIINFRYVILENILEKFVKKDLIKWITKIYGLMITNLNKGI